MCRLLFCFVLLFGAQAIAAEPIAIWPDFAPGETTKQVGELLPFREGEDPPVTRYQNITQPTFTPFLAENPNGTGLVILPGGGYRRVVTNKEGSEIANWLNRFGVSVFVLSYRTQSAQDENGWEKPLQDVQRTMSLIRSESERWKLDPQKIGVMGFSAGGNAAARLLGSENRRTYTPVDSADEVPFRPDFAVLVYPWNLYDPGTDRLIDAVDVKKSFPPTFLICTNDDGVIPLGAAQFYMGLKKNKIPAELHIYGNGGHGYGLRPVPDSQVSSWPEHCQHWLARQKLLKLPE